MTSWPAERTSARPERCPKHTTRKTLIWPGMNRAAETVPGIGAVASSPTSKTSFGTRCKRSSAYLAEGAAGRLGRAWSGFLPPCLAFGRLPASIVSMRPSAPWCCASANTPQPAAPGCVGICRGRSSGWRRSTWPRSTSSASKPECSRRTRTSWWWTWWCSTSAAIRWISCSRCGSLKRRWAM